MLKKVSQAGNLMPVTVTEGLTVNILPNEQYEYLMTLKDAANGYGTSKYAVSKAMQRNSSELIEGKHFVTGVDILSTPQYKAVRGAIQNNSYLLTKRGIVRLGFFIKSERAKLFRDWAEELIIRMDEATPAKAVALPAKTERGKRNHNRLTQERLVSILADVCRIEDKELRIRITDKLMGGHV